jgi:hypothetical protein
MRRILPFFLFAALALFEHVNLVYGTISEFCTTSGCPDMTGPGTRWVSHNDHFFMYLLIFISLLFCLFLEHIYGLTRKAKRRVLLHHNISTM